MWIKTTERWAHGESSTSNYYQYTGNDPSEFIKELQELSHDEYYWSDKYRGLKCEIVDKPPQEWIARKILDSRSRITSLERYVAALEGLIDKI